MKFLVAGDIHGDIESVKDLAKKAVDENVDAIILSGDFTYFDYLTTGTFKELKNTGKKIFVIPGNHEAQATIDFSVEKYGVYSLHGYSFDLGDVDIFGAGGANIGPISMNSEDELFSLLSKSFVKIKDKKKKIMITHVHPSSSLTERVSDIPGSSSLLNAINKFRPDFAIFSHIHEAHGIEEKIGNTKLICAGKEGTIIEL